MPALLRERLAINWSSDPPGKSWGEGAVLVAIGLRQLLRDLRSQKLRTFLTIFGIVWGTTAVSLLLAFGQGYHRQLMKNAAGLGNRKNTGWVKCGCRTINSPCGNVASLIFVACDNTW